MTRAGLHDQLVALAQHDHEAAGIHERASALDDQLEHVLERDLPADCDSHVAGGLEPSNRLLGLLAAALAGLIQAGVVDRDRGPVGEDHRGLLVALRELADVLLGEIEIAPGLSADADRHAQEAAHHRMPRREPIARVVLSHFREA